ncbi:MAG: hypothetical protein IVW36_02415 [Dehalococcoidia bacterium]|nr:hypothetical protein [Dehalococcoidia bacterium]
MKEDLRATVEAQARAQIAGDAARFASFMTPAALLELGRSADATRGIAPKRYRIIEVRAEGDAGESQVRFDGGGSYLVVTSWQRSPDGWKAIAATRPRDAVRQPWWRRWLRGSGSAASAERQELQ